MTKSNQTVDLKFRKITCFSTGFSADKYVKDIPKSIDIIEKIQYSIHLNKLGLSCIYLPSTQEY